MQCKGFLFDLDGTLVDSLALFHLRVGEYFHAAK